MRVSRNPPGPGNGVRDDYARHPDGAAGWYAEHGTRYRNPHEDAVAAMVQRSVVDWPACFVGGRILDVSCGSGEVTLALRNAGIARDRVDACDPFTADAYRARTGCEAMPWSFADIAGGCCAGRQWSVAICSYALHLCSPSWLATVCRALSDCSSTLIVITPHKRPALAESWGWHLVDEHHDAAWRVRLRRYVARS